MNDNIKVQINRKNALLKKCYEQPNNSNLKLNCNKYKNTLLDQIRQIKIAYYKKQFDINRSNPKLQSNTSKN